MMKFIINFVFLHITTVMMANFARIQNERDALLQKEIDMMLGSDIILTDIEMEANKIIMNLKLDALEFAFQNPQSFNFSKHFFQYKDEVKDSQLFKFILQMPKGAVLHAHDTGLLSPDYVLQLTYLENLYVCFEHKELRLLFSKTLPETKCGSEWQLMDTARHSSGNIEKFDAELRKYFTIVVDNPEETYSDINTVWQSFQNYFIWSSFLLRYKPVWEKYFYDTLKTFRQDNIMYIEIRSVLPHLYDLDGNEYDSVDTAVSYKKVLDEFMKDYPDFFGVKLIYAPSRKANTETIEEYINIAKKLQEQLPDFMAGFDLVGQEDLGEPTNDFLPQLTDTGLSYFFHAGETNWYGTSSDENLADAIVLDTRRIGHGFALLKHPVLIEEVRKRDIAIEVNVISNVVLKLVNDVRNHPLAIFLAQGLPVVLSSDDPGVWEAEPLSHDFYVAFMGVASRHADLKLLKKLALNSLYYSTYPDKVQIVNEFEKRWLTFIYGIIEKKGCNFKKCLDDFC